jgi:uncharacterized protein
MRRSEKEMRDRSQIDAVIRDSLVCRLAFAQNDEPYLVPLSFGYDGACLFFHTAREGRKIRYLEAGNRVCFEFERNVALVQGDVACGWTLSFESVIGFGTVSELLASAEKAKALNQTMQHYSGRDWDFTPASLEKTRVWKLKIESLTGKSTPCPDGN